MTTIGDSFAIVAVIVGICLSAWALMMSVPLVFPGRADHARQTIAHRPWRAFLLGMAMWLTLGFFGFALLANPFPIAKLLGWIVVTALFSISAVGASGLALLASERLRSLAPEMTHYAAISKSAAVIVVAGLVPILGWFLVVPFIIFATTGAGIFALTAKSSNLAESPRFLP